MDKVVHIGKRIANRRQREQLRKYREKVQGLQKVMQCSSCHLRCAMCGLYLRTPGSPQEAFSPSYGFIFCESCREEFEDFLVLNKGGKTPEKAFWHNREWFGMWSAWLNYRKALAAFVSSPEFRTLMEEDDT
ncbi:MAG: hypothetical protein JW821_06110 [Deltaproteobacteria bacterium]|nr:hypothetical protein [Deltaproteobacteria bacterium]